MKPTYLSDNLQDYEKCNVRLFYIFLVFSYTNCTIFSFEIHEILTQIGELLIGIICLKSRLLLKQRARLMRKIENLVFIVLSSNTGSCEPVQICRLYRTFIADMLIHQVRCTCADQEGFVRGVKPDNFLYD